MKAALSADFKKEVIAFANSDGGTIYIGIADDGHVIGVVSAPASEETIRTSLTQFVWRSVCDGPFHRAGSDLCLYVPPLRTEQPVL